MGITMCETDVESRQERLRLLKAIMDGGGAWSREARAVLALAQERGVTLDDDTLVYSDVRDLQAMQWRLQATSH
ncbi:MAG TPA: hypothetical protein VKT52_11970 [Ktedonobacterales bacterium]|nr:hypothetical protein [Ktedonobacterales bacterium]